MSRNVESELSACSDAVSSFAIRVFNILDSHSQHADSHLIVTASQQSRGLNREHEGAIGAVVTASNPKGPRIVFEAEARGVLDGLLPYQFVCE